MSTDGIVTSTANPAVVAAVQLHRARHRHSAGRTLIEGPTLVAEAIRAGAEIVELFGCTDADRALAEDVGAVFHRVTDHVLVRIAGTKTPRGPIAIIAVPEPSIPTRGRLLVTWGVADPGNCGTLLRTAAAFGFGYVSGPGSADSWSPKVLRSAAGGHFRTVVGEATSLADLGERQVLGTVAVGGDPVGKIDGDAAILVGSEAHGLPPDVLAGCDRLVSIPMPGGTESLNAAVSGSIVAYLGAIGDGD